MKDFDQSYDLLDVEGDGDTARLVNRSISRDGRVQAERSFKLNGETFTYRPAVAPEEIMDYYRMVNGDMPALTEPEAQKIVERTILTFMEPGQEEAWKRARRVDCENPVTIGDMRGVMQWLLGAQAGRPTGPSSVSSNGSATTATGTRSTDDSSLQAGEVSAA